MVSQLWTAVTVTKDSDALLAHAQLKLDAERGTAGEAVNRGLEETGFLFQIAPPPGGRLPSQPVVRRMMIFIAVTPDNSSI